MLFSKISFKVLQSFQLHLIESQKLKPKSAKNIIDACFQALWIDARKQGLLKRDAFTEEPFSQLVWPRLTFPPSDLFTPEERDKILNYFKAKTPYADYAFPFTFFWTELRPSEVTALRWSNVDLGFVTRYLSRNPGT